MLEKDPGLRKQCFKILEFKPYESRDDVKFYHHKTEGYVLRVDGKYIFEDQREFKESDLKKIAKYIGISNPTKEDLHEIVYLRAIKRDKHSSMPQLIEQRNVIRKLLNKDAIDSDVEFINNCRLNIEDYSTKLKDKKFGLPAWSKLFDSKAH